MLLSAVMTLEEVAIAIESATPDNSVVPHTALLDAISKLPELQTLTLCLSSRTYLTLSRVPAIASNEAIKSFAVKTPTER